MKYFAQYLIHDSGLVMTEEAFAMMERAGVDPREYFNTDLDDLKRKHERTEAGHRDALSGIRQQAVIDAQGAWDTGDAFFAPVLFQPLKRDSAGWEGALQEITSVGWRLDSWQVIGSAPPPFGSTVTLIQTLFTR